MTKNQTGLSAYQKSGQTGGYSKVPSPGAPNYTEAWALVEAARRMAAAIELYSQVADPQAPKSREILREPLRLNWRLWTIFQAELIGSMEDENSPMPTELRTNMLTLCQFVDKHTTQSLADPTPDRLAILIDINRNIASGHMENPEAAAARATPESMQTTSSESVQSEENTDENQGITGFSKDV